MTYLGSARRCLFVGRPFSSSLLAVVQIAPVPAPPLDVLRAFLALTREELCHKSQSCYVTHVEKKSMSVSTNGQSDGVSWTH